MPLFFGADLCSLESGEKDHLAGEDTAGFL